MSASDALLAKIDEQDGGILEIIAILKDHEQRLKNLGQL